MTTSAPLPPGRLGLPVLGETLALLRNPFAFLDDRRRRYGHVFKSRVVGRDTIFLSGDEGTAAFYDDENISRAHAHPFPLLDLFGGVNMQMYDGPKQRALKTLALRQFDHAAMARHLPGVDALIAATLGRLAAQPELRATVELRRLAIEAICGSVLGLPPGPATEAICADYGLVLTGIVSLPVAIPGTAYARARAARDRLLAELRRLVGQRRAAPGADALSRMLADRAPDGTAFTDEEAALEVHHMVLAGFIVYGLMAETLRRLAERPELRERCAREIAAQAAAGPLTPAALARLPVCTNVILEAKRLAPIVPLVFGSARRTFTCAGFTVPEGWAVHLALRVINREPEVFADPDTFDPDRFAPGRAEHERRPLGFIPQGVGGQAHQCLGYDYSTLLALVFLVQLVRGYTWELPPQDLDYRWNTIPPEFKDGLRVRLAAR